jgi:hypothetical protein
MMADAPPKITIEAIESLLDQLQKKNRRRAEIDKDLDDLYFNEHKVEVVESPVLGVEPERLRMGRIPASMNLIEGLFDQYPLYSLLPFGTGRDAIREAERVEKFSNASVRQAEREAREDTYGLDRLSTLRFGRSFTVVLRADHYWVNYPKPDDFKTTKKFNTATEDFKKGSRLPIVIRHIPIAPTTNGISAYPLLAGGHMLRFVRSYTLQVAEIIDRFGKEGQGRHPEVLQPLIKAVKDGERSKNPRVSLTDEMKMVDYYDDKRVTYALVDTGYRGILREWEHKMADSIGGKLPVVMTEGIVTGDPSTDRRWKAVYQDAREVVLHEDRLASRQATNVRINYYKSYFGLADEAAVEAGKGDTIEFEPGKLTILQGLKQFGAVDTQSRSEEAQLLEAKLERMLERHLLPSVLTGVQGAHDEPAWGTNLRIRQAEKRYKTIATHLASGRVGILQLVFHAVMAIGERVWAIDEDDNEWSITPDEAERYLNRIRVKIEPRTIIDRNADVQAAQGQIELGLPRRLVFEDTLGYEQPVELMEERILEDMQFDPNSPLYARTQEDILRRAQLLDEEEEAATEEEALAAIKGEVGPGAAMALMQMMGGGNGAGGEIPLGFTPGPVAALSPQDQAQMKTGRRQGRQPRPRQAPRSVRSRGG